MHWCETNYIEWHNDVDEILSKPLWLNSDIRMNNEVIYWPNKIANGPWTLCDIYSPESGILSYSQLTEKYPECKLSWLEYGSIVSALPTIWKTQLKQERPPKPNDYTYKINTILTKPKISNTIYKETIEQDSHLSKYSNCWYHQHNITPEPAEYKRCFSLLYHITKNVKLRNFQYRLLLNKIITNVDLNAWKIIESSSCTFCGNQVETITHLLYSCPYATKIRNISVAKWGSPTAQVLNK